MIERIGTVDKIPQFLEDVKAKKELLFGFGHRVYRNTDPRSKVIREVAETVFEAVGREPLIDVAIALRDAALQDEFFVKRKLFPNVDYWSGLIYKAMGFPLDFFPVSYNFFLLFPTLAVRLPTHESWQPEKKVRLLMQHWIDPFRCSSCGGVVSPLETESR